MYEQSLTLDVTTPVGPLARFYPSAIDVFESMDIDYACSGGRPLADAATSAGIEPQQLLNAVRKAVSFPAVEGTLVELIHQIVTEHHDIEQNQMRDLLARLAANPEGAPERDRIRRIFAALVAAGAGHMRREERELFERIEELELHPHRIRAGTVSRRMFAEFVEHDITHDRLVKIRELTLRLRVRGTADSALLDELDTFDRKTHRHMHLENNVLVPRVISMENRLKQLRDEMARPQG